MYSIASDSTDAVSVFPKGETNCWSAVILSPIFSFLTLKAGKVDGVSFRGLFVDASLLLLFLGFSSRVDEGNCICSEGNMFGLMTSAAAVLDAFQKGALLEKCN